MLRSLYFFLTYLVLGSCIISTSFFHPPHLHPSPQPFYGWSLVYLPPLIIQRFPLETSQKILSLNQRVGRTPNLTSIKLLIIQLGNWGEVNTPTLNCKNISKRITSFNLGGILGLKGIQKVILGGKKYLATI